MLKRKEKILKRIDIITGLFLLFIPIRIAYVTIALYDKYSIPDLVVILFLCIVIFLFGVWYLRRAILPK